MYITPVNFSRLLCFTILSSLGDNKNERRVRFLPGYRIEWRFWALHIWREEQNRLDLMHACDVGAITYLTPKWSRIKVITNSTQWGKWFWFWFCFGAFKFIRFKFVFKISYKTQFAFQTIGNSASTQWLKQFELKRFERITFCIFTFKNMISIKD